jgi:drug/metabolite transporter (DMT)-like permease
LQTETSLETIFDWISIAVFAGLIVLFLQRSAEAEPRDQLWQYGIPAVGCAVSNYLGNEDYVIGAILVLAGALGYIWMVLKPQDDFKPR